MSSHYALCRSIGSGIPFILGDGESAVTVLLQPMRLVDWGVLEQIILLDRKKSVSLDTMDEAVAEVLKESIKADRSVTLDELIHFASTRIGSSWRLWLSLRLAYPYWRCSEWIDKLIQQNRLGEYLAVALQIDGMDTYANLDWPILPYQQELAQIRKGKSSQGAVDWKVHVNLIAEVYGISPKELGELTYYQARLLLWDRETLSGKLTISPEELKNVVTMRRMQRLYEEKMAAQASATSQSTE